MTSFSTQERTEATSSSATAGSVRGTRREYGDDRARASQRRLPPATGHRPRPPRPPRGMDVRRRRGGWRRRQRGPRGGRRTRRPHLRGRLRPAGAGRGGRGGRGARRSGDRAHAARRGADPSRAGRPGVLPVRAHARSRADRGAAADGCCQCVPAAGSWCRNRSRQRVGSTASRCRCQVHGIRTSARRSRPSCATPGSRSSTLGPSRLRVPATDLSATIWRSSPRSTLVRSRSCCPRS